MFSGVPYWIKDNLRTLYFLSAISGSSFSAIALCNSYLFQLPVFCMGLPYYHQSKFQNKRFFFVVLIENIPQLIIQLVTLILSIRVGVDNDDLLITIFSMLFTLISLFLSVFEYFLARKFIKSSHLLMIRFMVESQQIEALDEYEFFGQIGLKKFEIVHYFAKLLHVNIRHVERLMPIQTDQGMAMTFLVDAESVGFDKIQQLVHQSLIMDRVESTYNRTSTGDIVINSNGGGDESETDSECKLPPLGKMPQLKVKTISDISNGSSTPFSLSGVGNKTLVETIRKIYKLEDVCRIPIESLKIRKMKKKGMDEPIQDITKMIMQNDASNSSSVQDRGRTKSIKMSKLQPFRNYRSKKSSNRKLKQFPPPNRSKSTFI